MSTTKKRITKKKLMEILQRTPEEHRFIDDFFTRKRTHKEWLQEYWRWRAKKERHDADN